MKLSVVASVFLHVGLSLAQGLLAEVKGEAGFFTFKYSTTEPDPTNWVGLYSSAGGGPVDEKFVAPSLVWKYAPEAEGTVALSTSTLESGNFTAFFLARDGYEWLADPIEVVLPAEVVDVKFMATDVVLANARQGDKYSQKISGLVKGSDSVTFKLNGRIPKWLSITADGILSGTPGLKDTDAEITIKATSGNSKDVAHFTIPVRPAGSKLLEQLQVMSFNMWHGGTRVNSYHEKQVRFLATSGADIVGLQEDQSGNTVRRLANALGWYAWASGDSMSILSKYPIVQEHGVINRSGGVRVALDGETQQVNFYSLHLGYDPYGPYDFCFDKMTVERVLEREARSGRTPQITDTMAALEKKGHLSQADDIPLLVVGDFNAPSHLDWVEDLKEKNCGVWNVPWPTSVLPTEKGLIDSFRVAHPDPVQVPGITWSPLFPWNDGRNLPEPQDRIDFIYHKGKGLKVLESRRIVIGEPKPDPNYQDNEWTSDHAAMLTVYKWVD